MKKNCATLLAFFCGFLIINAQQYEVFNTSVNSEDADFGVTFTNNNNVLFASSKKNEKDVAFSKERRRNNSQLHLELYSAVVNENGDIIQTTQFTNEKNNKYFESDITFSPDLKTVFFTWNNFYNTQKRIDSAKWKTLHIVKATYNNDFELINTEPLPFSSDDYSVRCPEMSKDGKQLYFASDMPGGYGGYDLYVVDIYDDGSYSEPKNLGANVNSRKDEMYPFITLKNELYFSSTGHSGMGRFDIFLSKLENGSFGKPLNLPKPVNSKFDDFAFVINSHHNSGYFSSTREGGLGDVDIYAFKINLHPEVCKKSITGEIFNANTEQRISNVRVNLFKDDEMVDSQLVSLGNKFRFELRCDETYTIQTNRFGFALNEFDLTKQTTDIDLEERDIYLTPEVCHQHLTIKVFDKFSNESLSNAKISVAKNNVLEGEQTVNENGSINFELECNARYRFNIKSADYRNHVEIIETTTVRNDSIQRKIGLSYSQDFIVVNERKLIRTGRIDFELDEAEIMEQTGLELNRVVETMEKYPDLRVLIESHTDSRAPDDYNLTLSKNRAQVVRNYLISKGIPPNRLNAKGFGETKLLNECSNGVKCSESQHLQNRRTEIVVISE